jgi:hypothetical protein
MSHPSITEEEKKGMFGVDITDPAGWYVIALACILLYAMFMIMGW